MVIGVNVPEDGWAFFHMPIVLILDKIMLPGDASGFLQLPLLCYLWRIKVAVDEATDSLYADYTFDEERGRCA